MRGPVMRTLLIAGLALASLGAGAAGDARRGADTFAEECGDCHSALPGKDKKGPTLTGVLGRKAGTVPSFAAGYSDALKASGLTWTVDRLDAYIAAPRRVVPAGKMKYD